MADNFFDQFDDTTQAPVKKPATNYFDQFDTGSGKTTPVIPAKADKNIFERAGEAAVNYAIDFVGNKNATQRLTENSTELAGLEREQLGGEGPVTRNLKKAASAFGVDPDAAERAIQLASGFGSGDNLLQQLSPQYHKQKMEEEAAARDKRAAELKVQIAKDEAIAKTHQKGLDYASEHLSGGLGALFGDPRQALPTIGALVGGAVTKTPQGAAVGSAVASAPLAAEMYDQYYVEGRKQFKLTDEQADQYATALAGMQMGTESLGGVGEAALAKGAGLFGAKKVVTNEIKEQLLKKITSRTARIAGAAAVEAGENVAGTALEDATREGMAKFGADVLSPETIKTVADFNRKQEATAGSRYTESAVQGGTAGAILSGPIAFGSHAIETGDRTANVGDNAFRHSVNEAVTNAAAAKAEADKAQQAHETDKAYQQRQEQQTQAEQQKADQQEADFRNADIARTVAANPNSLGRAALIKWTPEMVAQERARNEAKAATTEKATVVDAEATAKAKTAADIAKRKAQLETQKKVAEATALKEKEKADKAAAAKRYNDTRDTLIQNNPEATPEQLAEMLHTEMAKPVEAPPAPKAGRKARKAAVVAAETPAAPAATEAVTEATPEEETAPVDIQDLAAKAKAALNTPLGMAQTTAADSVPAAKTQPKLRDKIHKFVGSLVGDNSQTSVDVQNVINQGKLVMGSTPEELGRKTPESGPRAAEYDPTTGKMYVYLDHLDTGDNGRKAIVAAMQEAAVHESTHAGQDTSRKGRGSLMHTLLGADKYNAAHKAIVKAAEEYDNGTKRDAVGKLASEALKLAKADTKANAGDDSVEHLEVVGYFAGEAAKSRQGLGRFSGVVRDIKSGAKKLAKEKLGVNMDFNLSDLESTSQRVVGEVAKTDMKTRGRIGEHTTLAMIIPTRAASYMPGLDRVYQDPVDKEHKFVISDQLSAITERPEKIRQVLNGEVKLSQLMSHDELYKQMPPMKNITVSALKNAPPNTGAQAFPHEHAIEVHPILLERAAEGLPYAAEQLRDVLLHEVQHIVQHQGKGSGGGNSGIFFTPEEVNILRAQKLATKQAKEAAIALLNEVDAPVSKDASPESLVEDAKDVAQLVKDTGEDGYSKHTLSLADETLQASDRLERVKSKTNDLFSKYHADYENIHGEREARFTAANRNKSLENLPVNPTAIAESAGGLPGKNEEAHVTTRDANGNQFLTTAADRKAAMVRPATLGMASVKANKDNATHEIVDLHTGKVVDHAIGIHSALRKVDNRDNKYGATRYQARRIREDSPRTLGMAADNSDLYEKKPSHLYTPDQVIRGADVIAAMSEDERDNMEPWDGPARIGAYHYYEARKLMPKPSDKFKKVTDDNSFQLHGEVEYVANVDGTLFGINKFEDPDDEDETVWAFQRMDDAKNTTTETTTNDKGEAIKEMRATLSPRTLGMAASGKVQSAIQSGERQPNKTPLIVSQLFSSTAGTSAKIREILEAAQSLPSGWIRDAEHYLGNYQDALVDLARERNTTPQIVANEITKALDAIDKTSDDYATNFKAFKAVANKYGAVGKALIDFRNLVDQLSVEMIADRASHGTKLTKAEEETYTTISNNLGRYAHRQFAINLGDSGKKFARDIWKDYAKVAAKGGVGSGAMLDNYERVARAVGALVDDVTIPDDVDALKADKVRQLYDVWGDAGNPKRLSLDDMRDELDAMRDRVNGDKKAMVKEAELIAKQILDIGTKPQQTASKYRGGQLDTTILQERTHMNPAIRELMGEITEPGMRMFVTVGKVAEFIARNRSLAELTQLNDPQNIQPPGPASRPEVNGMIVLDNEAYGPAQGYYVSPNLHGLLESHVQQLATYETAIAMALSQPKQLPVRVVMHALAKWTGLAAATKATQLFSKPISYAINFAGGPLHLLTHGNLNLKHVGNGFATAASLIHAAWNPHAKTPRANRALTAGITDSVFTGDVNLAKRNEVTKLLAEMSGKSPNVMYAIGRKYVKKGVITSKEFYSMMDVVWKLANWHQQADAVLPAWHKALGDGMTQAQIDREAADVANTTNLTFKRLPGIVKGAERGGVTMFGGFMYGSIATEIANLKRAVTELEMANNAPNEEAASVMRWQATRRFMGIATAGAGLTLASSLLSKAAFGGDDDKNKKIRALLYAPTSGHDFVKLGKTADGKQVLYDVSAVDPFGPLHDIFRDLAHKKADGKQLAQGLLGLYILPRVAAKMGIAVATTVGATDSRPPDPILQAAFKKKYGKFLDVTKALGIPERDVRAWTSVVELRLPIGALGAQRENNPIPETDTAAGVVGAAIRSMGGTLSVIDPFKNAQSAQYEYKDAVKQGRTEFKDMLKDHPDITEAQMLSYATRAIKNEQDAWKKLKVVQDGMEALDYTPEEIAGVMKKARITPAVAATLTSGEFSQTVVSDKSFKGQIAGRPEDEKKKLLEQWDNMKQVLENTTRQEATND